MSWGFSGPAGESVRHASIKLPGWPLGGMIMMIPPDGSLPEFPCARNLCPHAYHAEKPYLYDGDVLLATFGQHDVVEEIFVNGPTGRMASYYENNDDRLFFYLNDNLGSPRAVYKYTGKPLEEELGLDIYYYGARYYDPILGRFTQIDPLAVKHPRWSSYVYCLANPHSYVDPDGRDAVPIVFRSYEIQTPVGKLSGLGHAGVLLIDNKTGYTKYYEYGRYGNDDGSVGSYAVPNVVMDSTGMPTAKSLGAVFAKIAAMSGHSGDISAAYIANDNFAAMRHFADSVLALTMASNRTEYKYGIFTRNCMHFVRDVLAAGGVDTPSMIDPRPNSYIEELRANFRKMQATAEKKWGDVYGAENN